MLAICSDLDETPDGTVYGDIARFLNTDEMTPMGRGVGLEVGNTIYFDMPPDQFAYWNTDDAGRAMVRDLIRSGHIDVLHSYGDRATRREHAARALDELSKHDCQLRVWADHSKAVSNFGADIMFGQGDVPASAAYHADLTVAHGVRYVWRGRVTSVIGQDVPPSRRGIFQARHPLGSSRTWAKEAAKWALGQRGHEKYAMHADNRVLRLERLRDGQRVHEFLRCNPYWDGVGAGATADGLADVVSEGFLNRLEERAGVCILYTHLGKIRDRQRPFHQGTCTALRRLASRYHDGRILVTTTSRLLDYVALRDGLRWAANRQGERIRVDIEGVDDPMQHGRTLAASDLGGLTFQLQGRGEVEVRDPGGAIIKADCVTAGCDTEVSVPFRQLEFPRAKF